MLPLKAVIFLVCAFALPNMAYAFELCQTADNTPLPQDPSSITMAATQSLRNTQDTISLYECLYTHGDIICYLAVTRQDVGSDYYYLSTDFLSKVVLFDNFLIPHKAIGGAFCNGRDEPVQIINLSRGEVVWEVLEFADGAPDIRTARISYPWQIWTVDLAGPVLKPS